MKLSVRISSDAEADIERNAFWWADHHSVDEAIEWETTIRVQLFDIGNATESHGFAAENDSFPYEIRDALLGKGRRGSYRAIFTLAGDTVVVLRVVRSSQGSIRPNDVLSSE